MPHSKNSYSDDKGASKTPTVRKPYKVVIQLDSGFVEQSFGTDPTHIGKFPESALVKECVLGKSRSLEGKEYHTISIFDEDDNRKWSCTDKFLDRYHEFLKATTQTDAADPPEARVMEYVLIIPDGRISSYWLAVPNFRPGFAPHRQERKTDPGNHERDADKDSCEQIT